MSSESDVMYFRASNMFCSEFFVFATDSRTPPVAFAAAYFADGLVVWYEYAAFPSWLLRPFTELENLSSALSTLFSMLLSSSLELSSA